MRAKSRTRREQAAACDFVLPGDPEALTGGYLYDRHIVEGLATLGWRVQVRTLDDSFPLPTPQAVDHAQRVFASVPDGRIVVIDGLALAGLSGFIEAEASRLCLVALIHHPLAEETGLCARTAGQLHEAERSALSSVRRTIVTSRWTAELLMSRYGVGTDILRVVEPGTARAALARGGPGRPLNLLCVGTLIPRKGHAVLIEALARLHLRSWQLICIGSVDRDRHTADDARRLIERHGLEDRIRLLGEVDQATLEHCYHEADLFVLPSYFEGYGMALTEALARGLPVIATTGGAIPRTVPEAAGILVPPGDVGALTAALARVLDRPSVIAELTGQARNARCRLPTWDQASRAFAEVLNEL